MTISTTEKVQALVDVLTSELSSTARLQVLSQVIDVVTSVKTLEEGIAQKAQDDFHSLEELYNFRMVMHAHLAIMWHRFGMYPVVKSWRHHDGEECFDGNYFIVVAQLPTGQISNHYKKEYWGLFQIPNQEFAPKWDGHNSQDVLKRLTEELASLPIAIMNVGNNDTAN